MPVKNIQDPSQIGFEQRQFLGRVSFRGKVGTDVFGKNGWTGDFTKALSYYPGTPINNLRWLKSENCIFQQEDIAPGKVVGTDARFFDNSVSTNVGPVQGHINGYQVIKIRPSIRRQIRWLAKTQSDPELSE